MKTKTTEQADHETLVQLVRGHEGLRPSGFDLKVLADGSRRIKGPYATACYPAHNWAERFRTHLQQGFFTRPAQPPAVARQPAPASGGTGL